MTNKKTTKPASKAAATKAVEPVKAVPAPEPQPAISRLAGAALAWFNPDANPLLDVADEKAAIRAAQGSWPTVLRLSQEAFRDLCQHPSILAYLAQVRLQKLSISVHQELATLLGLDRLLVDEAAVSASLE